MCTDMLPQRPMTLACIQKTRALYRSALFFKLEPGPKLRRDMKTKDLSIEEENWKLLSLLKKSFDSIIGKKGDEIRDMETSRFYKTGSASTQELHSDYPK